MNKSVSISLAFGLAAFLAACNTSPQPSGTIQADPSNTSSNLKAKAINKLIKASGPKSWDNIVQEGTAIANGRYTASFRIKGVGQLTLRFFEGSWSKNIANLDCSASSIWKTCSIPVTMGANPKFTFNITNSGPGSTPTFIDDVALTDSSGKNILVNGNFEAASIAPWWSGSSFTLVSEDDGTGGGTQPPTTGTTVWKNVEIGGGGMVTGLVVHPKVTNVVFARTDVGGAYRWNEASSSWTPLMDQFTGTLKTYMSVDAMALDPNNVSTVYASVGSSENPSNIGETAILKSTDSGTNWTVIRRGDYVTGNRDYRDTGERLGVDPTNSQHIVYGTRLGGLFESTNGGSSFNPVSSVPISAPIVLQENGKPVTYHQGVAWVQFDKAGNAYVGVSKAGIFKGAGGTWTKISPAELDDDIPTHATIASDGTLYAAYMSPDGEVYSGQLGYVFRYRAGTWTNITPPAGSWKPNAIAVSPVDPNFIAVTPYNALHSYRDIWFSRDAGVTWKSIPFDTGRFTPQEGWLSSGEFVFVSQSLTFDAFNPKRIWGTSGMGVWRSDNFDAPETSTFTTYTKGIAETIDFMIATPPGSGKTFVAVGDVCGMKWTNLDAVPKLQDRFTSNHMNCVDIAYSEKTPTAMAIVGRNWDTYNFFNATSRDGGNTWQEFQAPFGGYGAGRIAISSGDPQNLVWAGQGQNLYYSKDGGKTWTITQGANGGSGPGRPVFNSIWTPVWPLTADPERGGVFYSYGSYDGFQSTVSRSEDGGATWKTVYTFPQGFFENVRLRSTPGQAGHLWLGTPNAGAFRSLDGGNTWTPLAGFSEARDVSLGKAQTAGAYPTIFVMGTRAGKTGVYRSLDQGSTWVLTSPNPEQNVLSGSFTSLTADRNMFGRVYVATSGRGTFYGMLK
jgi:xyloglucan-specific exo-beta-1,4-glucanase